MPKEQHLVDTGLFHPSWALYLGNKRGERWDSNPRQPESQSGALPTELRSPYARLAGLEPATLGLEGRCSIQLSYKRIVVSGRRDSNPRHPAPKAGALPDCATPRFFANLDLQKRSYMLPLLG